MAKNLRSEIADLVEALNEFDRKYLIRDELTGRTTYPAHVIPQVQAIRDKLRRYAGMDSDSPEGHPLAAGTNAVPGSPTSSLGALSAPAGRPMRDEIMWEVGLNDDLAFLRKRKVVGSHTPKSKVTTSRIMSPPSSGSFGRTKPLSLAEAKIDEAIEATLQKINTRLDHLGRGEGSEVKGQSSSPERDQVVADLQRRLAAASERHRQTVTPLLQAKAELEQKVAQREQTIEDLTRELAQKKAQIESMERQIQQLKQGDKPIFDADGLNTMLQIANQNVSAEQARAMKERDKQFNAAVQEYEERLAFLEQQSRDDAIMIAELQQKLFSSEQQTQILQHNLDTIGKNMDRSKFELLAMVADLEREKKDMGQALYTTQLRRDQLEQELASLNSQRRVSDEERKQIEAERKKLQQQLDEIHSKMRQTTTQLIKQKLRLASARYVSLWYRDKLGQSTAAQEEATKLLRERIHNQPIIVWDPDAENAKAEQDRTMIDKVLKSLQEENAGLRSTTSKLSTDLSQAKRQLEESESKRVTAEQRSEILSKELEKLRALVTPLLSHQRELQALSGLGSTDALTETKALESLSGTAMTSAVIEAAQQHISFVALDSFHGDYKSARTNNSILSAVLKRGEHEISFSDLVTYVNDKNKTLEQILVITENYMFLFERKSNMNSMFLVVYCIYGLQLWSLLRSPSLTTVDASSLPLHL